MMNYGLSVAAHPVRSFESWHFPMLNDRSRNEAMEASIRSMDIQGKTILDIGTGAGLTAMMFARHGARRVLTCELDSQLFDIAVKNIEANGFSHCIEVINKSSGEAITDGDIDFIPDIIFTETLDCGVIGEGFHSISSDIKKLSGDHTVVVPQVIEQFGYLADCESMLELNQVGPVCGFDLDALNQYRTRTYFPVRHHLHRVRALSDVSLYRIYDYLHQSSEDCGISVVANGSGKCHGLVSFFRARFGSFCVTNDPRHHGHWHQAFHPLDRPVEVRAGETYNFGLSAFGSFDIRSL